MWGEVHKALQDGWLLPALLERLIAVRIISLCLRSIFIRLGLLPHLADDTSPHNEHPMNTNKLTTLKAFAEKPEPSPRVWECYGRE